MIIQGDALEELKKLDSESVDMVMTSPPYWSLRSYLPKDHPDKAKEIGSEPTFKEYLDKMMLIFAEVKRVLKPTGSFWLDMGDSYGTSSGTGSREGSKQATNKGSNYYNNTGKAGLPGYDKSLIGQPWRMAIRMIDEQGWILRADINWIKQILIYKKDKKYTMGSVMPSSVKDRVNMASEHLFHFVKSKKYSYDIDAVRIPAQTFENRPDGIYRSREYGYNSKFLEDYSPQSKQHNVRNSKYKGKFTGNPDAESFNSPRARTQRFNYRVRDSKKKSEQCPQFKASEEEIRKYKEKYIDDDNGARRSRTKVNLAEGIDTHPNGKNIPNNWLIGTEPSREHHFAKFPSMLCRIPILATCPKGGIVLDPFAGSGTALVVAKQLDRNYLGIELNADYVKLARDKIKMVPDNLL